MLDDVAKIEKAVDEMLVNLGRMVLRLSSPEVTRTRDEREALARSVNQFSVCAARSCDPRVLKLAETLKATIKPHLRLIVSRA